MSKNILQRKRILTKAGGGSSISTPVSVANGGTGISSYAIGDIIYASGTTTLSKLAIGTANQQLRVNAGATALEYFTPAASGITINSTAITGGGANRILFENSSNQVSESATNFYFTTATPFSHVFAAGRSGTITGVNNSLFGYDAGGDLTTGRDNVIIGYTAANNRTDMLQNVVIGSQATATATMDRGVVIGYGASGATATVSIGGESKNTSQNSVSVGYRAAYGVALGGSHTYSISIGSSANLSFAYNSSIAIGYNVGNTATNQGILGSNDSNGYISDWYFNGVTHTSAYSVNLRGSGGSGSNNVAANLNLYAGLSTGSGTPATIGFYSSAAGASSSSAQAAVKVLEITNSTTITTTDAVNLALGSTTGTKIGTADTQKLAFWNATPIVQQVLATGAAATVDDVITLLQTLGLCKQS